MIHTAETQIKRLEDFTTKNLRLPNTHNEKMKMIKLGILPAKCSVCDITNWLDQELVLHLDHIDGNPRNNLVTNLRLLCPNCHSQTPTYCGRNNKGVSQEEQAAKPKPRCLDCNKPVSASWIQRCCKCSNSYRKERYNWPPDKEFEELIKTRKTMEGLAKQLQVSSNAIRKRCINLGIDYSKANQTDEAV